MGLGAPEEHHRQSDRNPARLTNDRPALKPRTLVYRSDEREYRQTVRESENRYARSVTPGPSSPRRHIGYRDLAKLCIAIECGTVGRVEPDHQPREAAARLRR